MSDIPPPPPPAAPGSPSVQHANFFERLIAVIIDGLIIGIPFGILSAIAGDSGAALGVVYLIAIVAAIWYVGEYEGNRGATIGKQVMKCTVVRKGTDQPLGFGRAVGRQLAKIVSGIPCYLGYLWMLWDSDKQTWHDKIAEAQVIKA